MIAILNWFDTADRFNALIIVLVLVGWILHGLRRDK